MMSSVRGPVVAGHRANFLPWFGYFDKMSTCDVFVFSDDVRYPKESFVNRVEIPIGGRPAYLTPRVRRGRDERIATRLYVKDSRTLERRLQTIRFNLGGLPHGRDLEPALNCLGDDLRYSILHAIAKTGFRELRAALAVSAASADTRS